MDTLFFVTLFLMQTLFSRYSNAVSHGYCNIRDMIPDHCGPYILLDNITLDQTKTIQYSEALESSCQPYLSTESYCYQGLFYDVCDERSDVLPLISDEVIVNLTNWDSCSSQVIECECSVSPWKQMEQLNGNNMMNIRHIFLTVCQHYVSNDSYCQNGTFYDVCDDSTIRPPPEFLDPRPSSNYCLSHQVNEHCDICLCSDINGDIGENMKISFEDIGNSSCKRYISQGSYCYMGRFYDLCDESSDILPESSRTKALSTNWNSCTKDTLKIHCAMTPVVSYTDNKEEMTIANIYVSQCKRHVSQDSYCFNGVFYSVCDESVEPPPELKEPSTPKYFCLSHDIVQNHCGGSKFLGTDFGLSLRYNAVVSFPDIVRSRCNQYISKHSYCYSNQFYDVCDERMDIIPLPTKRDIVYDIDWEACAIEKLEIQCGICLDDRFRSRNLVSALINTFEIVCKFYISANGYCYNGSYHGVCDEKCLPPPEVESVSAQRKFCVSYDIMNNHCGIHLCNDSIAYYHGHLRITHEDILASQCSPYISVNSYCYRQTFYDVCDQSLDIVPEVSLKKLKPNKLSQPPVPLAKETTSHCSLALMKYSKHKHFNYTINGDRIYLNYYKLRHYGIYCFKHSYFGVCVRPQTGMSHSKTEMNENSSFCPCEQIVHPVTFHQFFINSLMYIFVHLVVCMLAMIETFLN